MNYIIGVDGGGTKTAYVLADTDGNVINTYTGSTIHYLQIGYEGLARELSSSFNRLLSGTRVSKHDISFSFLGVAGYGDITEHQKDLDRALDQGLDGIPYRAENDSYAALSGALAGKSGICIIAGTGSIGLGRTTDGRSFTSGGWHHAFGGDEGSGHWLAEKYIQEFTKQSDGRHPHTQLYNFMMNKYGFKDDSEVMSRFVVDWEYDRTKIASLSTDVYELAVNNDPWAIQIFNEAAKELSEIVIAIQNKLKIEGTIEISYIGGVFKSGDFVLVPLKKYLNNYDIDLHAPIYSPEYGCLLECLKELNITIDDNIINNLNKK